MNTYEVKIMAQKQGKEPVRLGFYDVEATSEQVALEIATAAGKKHFDNVCEILGHKPNATVRIWAELAKEDEE